MRDAGDSRETTAVGPAPRSRGTVRRRGRLGPRAAWLRNPMELVTSMAARRKILIVDDDDLMRDFAVTLIRSLGYRCVAAKGSQDALEILRTQSDVALLFTDVRLGAGDDGHDLARNARAMRPDLAVLLTSGDAVTLDGRDRRSGVIAKPYRGPALASQLRVLLDSCEPGAAASR